MGVKQAKESKKTSSKDDTKEVLSLKKKIYTGANNFKELDDVLRNSFTAIKKDMLQLQEVQHQQLLKLNETRQSISGSTADFITVDKFNVIKIKIGELNENMKKLWELDKKLIEVDAKAMPEADFDKQASEWENEFEKVRQDIKEIRSTSIDEDQLNKLVQDLNEEFDSMKEHLDELRRIKDSITSGELEKRTKSIAHELEDLRREFQRIHKLTQEHVTPKQVESLIGDINQEFDEIKNSFKELESEIKDCVKVADLKKTTTVIEAKIAGIRKEMSVLNDAQKDLIRKDQVDVLLDDINNEFNDVKTSISDVENRINKDMNQFMPEEQIKKQTDRISTSITKLKTDLIAKEKELKTLKAHLKKDYFNNSQAQTLVDDMNDEFDGTKKYLGILGSELKQLRKDGFSKKEIESRIKKINDEFDRQDGAIVQLDKNIETFRSKAEKEMMKKKQAEALVEDINKEFDSLRKSMKQNSHDIDTTRKITNKNLKSYVKRKEFNDDLVEVRTAINDIHDAVTSGLVPNKKFNKISNYFKKSIHSLESDTVSKSRFNALVDEVDSLKVMIKKNRVSKADEKKIVATSQKLAKLKKKKNNVKLEKVKHSKDFVPFKKSYFVGNLLIVVAFLSLVASIVTFFLNQLAWTDKLAIFSVGAFVIGLIIRIIVIVNRTKLVNGHRK